MTNKNIMLFILSISFLFVLLFLFLRSNNLRIDWRSIINQILNYRVKKGLLIQYYGVDKSTFAKWIFYFCSEMYPDVTLYKEKRKLLIREIIAIVSILGIKDSNPIYTKGEIIKVAEGSYRSLRQSILEYPDRFNISIEAYINLRVFPPHISKLIIEQYS